jgi:hypothetical protein
VVGDGGGFYIIGLNHGLMGLPGFHGFWGMGKRLRCPLKPTDVETQHLASPAREAGIRMMGSNRGLDGWRCFF